jgi:hypothetical protein
MIKTAALVTLVAGVLLLGLTDDDGRIVGGDLAARALGYAVRIEVKIDRPGRLAPPAPWETAARCAIPVDSIVGVVP